MGKYIGIDLGTTCSVAAYINDNGEAEILPNYEGEDITPSTVLFDGNTPIVGKEAKKESIRDAEHFIGFVKRDMGNKTKRYSIDGHKYRPEEVSSMILKKILNDAEDALNDKVSGAVITVPAYFTEAQRKATEQAAELIGIPVMGILNEPTAAALSYGIGKGDEKEKYILVYDLGGGTFDVSVMKFKGESIETLSTMGNPELGGYDFDRKIADWFKKQASLDGYSIDGDLDAEQELLTCAEEAKKALCAGRAKYKITIHTKGKKVFYEITNTIFEDMIEQDVYSTITLMDRAMEEAGLEYSDLEKILLVGGSTRIPLVKRMIEEETESVCSKEVHPDKAVAIGAAWHALSCAQKIAETAKASPKKDVRNKSARRRFNQGISNDSIPEVELRDVPDVPVKYSFTDRTSHGIGIVVENEDGEESNSVILPKNSVIPAEAQEDYVTLSDYQEFILLKITEGEYPELSNTTIIGETELKLRPKPKGTPVRVTISCDTNGIVHVRVMDLQDQEDLGEMRIQRDSNMSEQEMEEAKNRLGKLNIG